MNIKETYKNDYNIFLGGSAFVGKTTYFNSYLKIKFDIYPYSSKEIDYKLIKKLNKNYLYLYDSVRWSRINNIGLKHYLKKADGVILMFDLSKNKDFDELSQLLNIITEFYELENIPFLLIGNKSYLDIEVDENEIEKFLDKENFVGYFEVSSKTNKNVDESVDFMVNYVYKKDKKYLYEYCI